MIRLVLIEDQISLEHSAKDFAFFDTVHDRFVEIAGECVFTSVKHLEECIEHVPFDNHSERAFVQRCLAFVKNNDSVKQEEDNDDA